MSGLCDAKDSVKGHAMAFPHSYILEIIVAFIFDFVYVGKVKNCYCVHARYVQI